MIITFIQSFLSILPIILILSITFSLFLFIIIHLNVDGFNRVYHPTPGFHASKIPSLHGKVIIITGGTTGVGRESAEQMCLKQPRLLIITSRSQSNADIAAEEIRSKYTVVGADTVVLGRVLSLEDHQSIECFVKWFKEMNVPLHILMLNAGLVAPRLESTSTGLEKTIGSNWFGHFYLQQLLQNDLEMSAPSRVVILSSSTANDIKNLNGTLESITMANRIDSATFDHYGISKLFNHYHAVELHRRLREKGINNIYVNSLHPGGVRTNFIPSFLGKSDHVLSWNEAKNFIIENKHPATLPFVIFTLLSDILPLDIKNGALTQLYLATSPDIELMNISGEYFYPIARGEDSSVWNLGILSSLSVLARDKAMAKVVWEYGESIIEKINKKEI